MSYITHTRAGSYCDVCGSPLSLEEIDWECCDACGGEGIGGDDDESPSDEDMDEMIACIQASNVASPSQGGKP